MPPLPPPPTSPPVTPPIAPPVSPPLDPLSEVVDFSVHVKGDGAREVVLGTLIATLLCFSAVAAVAVYRKKRRQKEVSCVQDCLSLLSRAGFGKVQVVPVRPPQSTAESVRSRSPSPTTDADAAGASNAATEVQPFAALPESPITTEASEPTPTEPEVIATVSLDRSASDMGKQQSSQMKHYRVVMRKGTSHGTLSEIMEDVKAHGGEIGFIYSPNSLGFSGMLSEQLVATLSNSPDVLTVAASASGPIERPTSAESPSPAQPIESATSAEPSALRRAATSPSRIFGDLLEYDLDMEPGASGSAQEAQASQDLGGTSSEVMEPGASGSAQEAQASQDLGGTSSEVPRGTASGAPRQALAGMLRRFSKEQMGAGSRMSVRRVSKERTSKEQMFQQAAGPQRSRRASKEQMFEEIVPGAGPQGSRRESKERASKEQMFRPGSAAEPGAPRRASKEQMFRQVKLRNNPPSEASYKVEEEHDDVAVTPLTSNKLDTPPEVSSAVDSNDDPAAGDPPGQNSGSAPVPVPASAQQRKLAAPPRRRTSPPKGSSPRVCSYL